MFISGDKSNYIPSFHVPQLYYFVDFTTLIGWPILLACPGGLPALLKDVRWRMFGTRVCPLPGPIHRSDYSLRRSISTLGIFIATAVTIRLST